ncbi:MAG: polyhydroxyalkanoate depolymerase, partial [Oscillospiraceae bacterium]
VKNVSRTGISVGSSHSAHSWEGHGGRIPADVKTNYGHTKVLIKNNFVDHAGGDGIVPQFCISPVIEHNICAAASQETTPGGGGSGQYSAGIWPWRCEDAVFQFNEAYGTKTNGDGQSYDCDSNRGTVYQYNYSHDNEGGFMLFCREQSLDSVVRYNVSQNDLRGLFVNSSTNGNHQIYNNTFYIGSGV